MHVNMHTYIDRYMHDEYLYLFETLYLALSIIKLDTCTIRYMNH